MRMVQSSLPRLTRALLVACVAACSNSPRAAPDGAASAPATDASATDANATDGTAPDAAPDAPALRVLFVGNSYTFVNDLPGTVAAILDATSPAGAEIESVTLGGARLADHWETTGARARIERGGLDVVVLQGQSLEAVSGAADFQAYAARFSGALAAVGARGVWYATWARRDVEASPETLWPAIEAQYALAAARNGDALARVGAAFEIALLAMPEVPLLAEDRSHPTPAGTLLAGCVIARAITGIDPRLPDPTPLGLPRDLAERLCAIARGGVPCVPEESLCGGACVPWDRSHCGGCAIACGEEEPCRRGVCGCEAGLIACDERCVVLGTTANCARCGDACVRGRLCSGGACACPASAALDVFSTFPELTSLEPACAQRDDAGTPACNEAAHRYCADTGCFASGFLPSGHAPRPEAVMCVPGVVRPTTFAALGALEPGCDGVTARAGQACITASHRLCVAQGALSGFGPVDAEGASAWVTCLSSGVVVRVPATELQASISRCLPDAGTCSSAAWNLCAARGHTAGFGPVESAGEERDVVCVG